MQSFLSLWGIWTYFFSLLAVVALSVSSVWLFCDPTDCSLPGSSVHGFPGKKTGVGCHRLLQEIFLTQGVNLHLLHWPASSLPLSRQGGPSAYSCAQMLSHVWLFATLWTVAWWAPLSLGFSWQECWSGVLFPPAGGLPDPGIKPASLCLLHWQWIFHHWYPLSLLTRLQNLRRKTLQIWGFLAAIAPQY